MPLNYFSHDEQWINSQLAYCVDVVERTKVCQAYSKVYLQAHDAEPHEVRKDGKARYAANSRLREYVAKKFRVFNK
jgi:hypothetical protein